MDYSFLTEYLDECGIEYEINVKTSSLASIRVGGTASIVVYPNTIEDLCKIMKIVHNKHKYYLIGNGTNIYFCEYFDGIIILTNHLTKIETSNNMLIAECGASLTGCAVYAYEDGLSGLEFGYGIPGSVGGGIYMNASAYGYAISDVVHECLVYDVENSNTYIVSKEDMMFGNKSSIFMQKKLIILSATFELCNNDKNAIKSKMDSYMQKRALSQPLDLPSAGSAFKRPMEGYASKLIDDAGLKGYCIGDAQISEKHAGFIVNKGCASAKNITDLINYVKRIIKSKYCVDLEEEIIYVE